jgi:hypothetical protein
MLLSHDDNIFETNLSSISIPLSCAARRASAARFLLRKAAPEDAFAILILAKRAFWNSNEENR